MNISRHQTLTLTLTLAVLAPLSGCGSSVIIPSSSAPALAPVYASSVRVGEPPPRGFEELAIVGVSGNSEAKRLRRLAKAGATIGADAVIDLRPAGRVPVFQLWVFTFYTQVYSGTAVTYLPADSE